MKRVWLVWLLLLPVAALAQSAFDGTWKLRLDSIKITAKPEVFSIVDGTYLCSTCPIEIKIPADGKDHTVIHDFTLAVTIVDAHTTRNTWKRAGKITDVTTIMVSADGSTITGSSAQYDGPEPVTATYTEKRVAAGPPGAHAVSGAWRTERITSGNDALSIVAYQMSVDGFSMKAKNGWSYEARFDGKEYPLRGDSRHTTVILERIDDHTVRETDRRDGKVVEEVRLVAGKDGKTIEVEDHDLIGGLSGEETSTYTLEKQ